MIKSVYENAGLDFAQTQYFEAHGTGTPGKWRGASLGDARHERRS